MHTDGSEYEYDLLRSAGSRYNHATLDSYEVYRPEQKILINEMRRLAEEIESPPVSFGLVLCGTVGTGKDHLMVSLMRIAARNGVRCEFVRFQSVMRNLRDKISSNGRESDVIKRMFTLPLLGISDPVPPGRALSGYNIDTLFSIIDERYARGFPTWVTMNSSGQGDANKRLSDPVMDRLMHDAEFFEMRWPSYRKPRHDKRGKGSRPKVSDMS